MSESENKSSIDPVKLLTQIISLQEQVKSTVATFVESRKEDREDRIMLRKDMDTLAKSMTRMSITTEKHLLRQTQLESVILEMKADSHEFQVKRFSPIAEKVNTHDKILEGNRVRWLILGTVLVTSVGLVFSLANTTIETALAPIAKNTEAQLLNIQNTQQMLEVQQKILQQLIGERND